MSELLLGCGHSRKKQAHVPGTSIDWQNLLTVDNNILCKPDLLCDLNRINNWIFEPLTEKGCLAVAPYSIGCGRTFENSFSEVHAYEVLEHLGRQGDIASFFSTFYNIWRILIPDGYLFATCPSRHSTLAWGDPGHTRIISSESLVFLDQRQYNLQLGKTAMSDYRAQWHGDFQCLSSMDDKTFHRFVLKAIKPSRAELYV